MDGQMDLCIPTHDFAVFEGVDIWCWCLILDILVVDMGDTGDTRYVMGLNRCIFTMCIVYSIRMDDAECWHSKKTFHVIFHDPNGY